VMGAWSCGYAGMVASVGRWLDVWGRVARWGKWRY
jgi:hypothetical protein